MNQIDEMLQTLTPTVMVPKFQELEQLGKNGHRFLVAANGLWMEARNHWAHVVLPMWLQSQYALPYGHCETKLTLSVEKLPIELIQQFVDHARQQPTIEVAGWIILNHKDRSMRLVVLESNSASASHVDYVCPSLGDDETLLIDIHSHGALPAFFSKTDDNDDSGSFKVAVVVGNLDTAEVSVCARLCVYGLMHPLPSPVLKSVYLQEMHDE